MASWRARQKEKPVLATKIWEAYEEAGPEAGGANPGMRALINDELRAALEKRGVTTEKLKEHGFSSGDGRVLLMRSVIDAKPYTGPPGPGGRG